MAYIKVHEIRAKLQSKVDPDVLNVLCALAERQSVHQQTFRQVAEIIDNLTNQFGTVIAAATKMTPEGIRAVLMGGKGKDTKDVVASMTEQDDDTGSTH